MTSEILKSPDGLAPRSLGEAATNVEVHIGGMQDGFQERMSVTLAAKQDLTGAEARTMQIVRDANTLSEQAKKLMVNTWKQDLTQVDERRNERTRNRERDLAKKDWAALANFYRKSAQLLKTDAGSAEGVTETQWKTQAKEFIKQAPQGAYLLKHFESDVMTLLVDPNVAAHDAFRATVYEYVDHDKTFPDEEKGYINSELRSVLDVVADFAIAKQNILSFSGDAVNGLLGRVLEPADMQKVVDRDYTAIEQLPAGSVRLVIGGDQEVTFHHEKQGDKIPEGILPKGDAEKIPHVVFVHYVASADVVKLLADMSDGQTLVAKRRGAADQSIEIEGKSGSNDFTVKKFSPDIVVEDLKKNPMRYLDHQITVVMTSKKP